MPYALKLRAISFDAIKLLLLARLERKPAQLDLTLYPNLPRATVAATDSRSYMKLLAAAPITNGLANGRCGMSEITQTATSVRPTVLLGDHLKALKLPTFLREYEKVAMESAQDRANDARYLLRLCELERIDRERRMVERRIRMAKFPQTKSSDTFDFTASRR